MARSLISWTSLWAICAVCIALPACKKGGDAASDTSARSLLFGEASPDAREALATPVNFRLTDANYAQWERAQKFLEALPASALPAASEGKGGSAIDRAVARLESSPRARTAVERTGLSVREFVLATIALAQATEASSSGKLASTSPVAAENLRFVQRYGSRIPRDRSQDDVGQSEVDYLPPDTAAQAEASVSTDADAQSQAGMADSATATRSALPDSQTPSETPPLPTSEPARDTVRDSLPAR